LWCGTGSVSRSPRRVRRAMAPPLRGRSRDNAAKLTERPIPDPGGRSHQANPPPWPPPPQLARGALRPTEAVTPRCVDTRRNTSGARVTHSAETPDLLLGRERRTCARNLRRRVLGARRSPIRGRLPGPHRQPEVGEDPADDGRVLDRRQHDHPPAAPRTGQHVRFEGPAHELRPVVALVTGLADAGYEDKVG